MQAIFGVADTLKDLARLLDPSPGGILLDDQCLEPPHLPSHKPFQLGIAKEQLRVFLLTKQRVEAQEKPFSASGLQPPTKYASMLEGGLIA